MGGGGGGGHNCKYKQNIFHECSKEMSLQMSHISYITSLFHLSESAAASTVVQVLQAWFWSLFPKMDKMERPVHQFRISLPPPSHCFWRSRITQWSEHANRKIYAFWTTLIFGGIFRFLYLDFSHTHVYTEKNGFCDHILSKQIFIFIHFIIIIRQWMLDVVRDKDRKPFGRR